MKKLLSVILAVMLVITACPLVALADEHTVRTEALILGSESISNEQEGWSYDADHHLLTLDNVTIDCSAAESDGNCITATEDLFIMLKGENTFKSKTALTFNEVQTFVIKYSGELAFNGTGTLNIIEGNYSLESTSSENRLIFYGGTINITHNLNNPSINENSNATLCGNNNRNTYISGGTVNSDVLFALKQINSGSINSYIVRGQSDLEIKGGEVNAALMFAIDLTINGGSVAIIGGDTKILASQFLTDSDRLGIVATNSFKMNGGSVYTHGSACALTSLNCEFNGGSFVAASEGIAVAAAGKSDDDAQLKISKSVQVDEPEDYQIKSFTYEDISLLAMGDNNPEPQTQTYYMKSVFDSSVQTPSFDANEDYTSVTTNAAKRVVITEVEHRTLKFNDENGDETYNITVTENDYDRLLSDVISEQLNVPQENIYIVFGCAVDDTVSKYLELVDGMAEESYDVNGELIIDTVWGTGDTYNSDWLGDYENTSEYHIKDARDFAAFKKSCFVDGNRFEGKTVYLDNDVDLGEHFWYVDASKVATDDGSTNYPKFSGVFDGCGHSVTGLKMFPVGGIATAGLFPFLKNAVVKNLSVDGVAMRSNLHWLGLLAGYAADSAVYNCFASGTIECVGRERNYDPGSTGALIGEAQHCAVINCGADADISLDYEHIVKNNYSGGMPKLGVLIGEATTKVEESFCVINCYSHGSISVLNTFQSAKVGGLIGVADDDLYNCYTDVQLTPNRPYSMYGTLVGELHAENVLNNAGQDGDNLGQYIIGNLFYPQGAQPFGWNNSVFHNTACRDVSEFASAYEDAEELCAALNAGTAQVDEIISAHRDVLADSSWADLLEQCNGGEVEAKYWSISADDNMPSFAEAYNGFTYEISGDNAVITGYLGNDTDITIPSEINGMPVTEIAEYALSGNENIKNIVVSHGIEIIHSYAFSDCTSLKSVTIPNSLTLIEDYFIANCISLSYVDFDGTYSELDAVEKGQHAFSYGGGLPLIIYFNSDPEPEILTGWQYMDGDWYYYDENGDIVTGWLKDGGKWYFLDEDGVMQTGWVLSPGSGKWFYLDENGVMQTGWIKSEGSGQWFYLKASGAMATGWVKVNGNWYYLKSSGAMATGWIKDGGKWYYLKSSGAMATGWLKDGGKWYYLNSSGAMVTGRQTINGKTYTFNSSGALL